MTPVNALGIRTAITVITITAIALGVWKLATLGFSHTAIQQESPSPIAEISPSPSPSPVQSLSPELLDQMKKYAQSTGSNIGPETKKYVATLPKDATQAQVLDQKNLTTYVSANQGQLLPVLQPGTIKTSTATGKAAIKTYLDSISQAQNSKIKPVTGTDIVNAFQAQEGGTDANALAPILVNVQSNFDLFKAIATPQEAVPLQTKLLQATISLIQNIKLIQAFKTDQISGLIGLKNVSDLDGVYADIATQISALEKKYNLQ